MASGRKLEFDKSEALDAAMRTFWLKGYQGTSLSDLTQAMGINKPSMYATFGNKETLFIQATSHYLEVYSKPKTQYLREPGTPFKERLKNYLMAVVRGQCDVSLPRGCYLALSTGEAAGNTMPSEARDYVDKVGSFSLRNLETFIETDSESSELGFNLDAKEKALFLITILNGTAALSRAGKTEEQLEPVIDRALIAVGLTP